MEKRKPTSSKSSPLPRDYLKMVGEIFTSNFDAPLKRLRELRGQPTRFEADGKIYADEVVVAVSLLIEGDLAATTIHASSDFDPKASSPTVEDLLGFCVDAIGSIFGQFLTSDARLKQITEQSLAALEGVPFDWTSLEIEGRKLFVKVDKSNPKLDQMADDFLRKHDPKLLEESEMEEKETESLFVTGPKKPSGSNGSGTVH